MSLEKTVQNKIHMCETKHLRTSAFFHDFAFENKAKNICLWVLIYSLLGTIAQIMIVKWRSEDPVQYFSQNFIYICKSCKWLCTLFYSIK